MEKLERYDPQTVCILYPLAENAVWDARKVMSANLSKVETKRMKKRDIDDLRDAEKRLELELRFLNGLRDHTLGYFAKEKLSGENALLGGTIQMKEKIEQWEKKVSKKFGTTKHLRRRPSKCLSSMYMILSVGLEWSLPHRGGI